MGKPKRLGDIMEDMARRAGVTVTLSCGPGETSEEAAQRILALLKAGLTNADCFNIESKAGGRDLFEGKGGHFAIPSPYHFSHTWPGCKPEEATHNGLPSKGAAMAGRDGNPGISMAPNEDVDVHGQPPRAQNCVRCGALIGDSVNRWVHERERRGHICHVCFQACEAEAVAEKIQGFNEPAEGEYKR